MQELPMHKLTISSQMSRLQQNATKKPNATKKEMIAAVSEDLKTLFSSPEGTCLTMVERWGYAKSAEMSITHLLRSRRARTDRARMLLLLAHEVRQHRLRGFVARKLQEERELQEKEPQEGQSDD